jgi:DNA-binding response OmpR family regulator
MNEQILIVEDDEALNDCIRNIFAEAGFIVRSTYDGSKALELIQKSEPDLVILDLGLPTISGETVCKEAKKNFPDIPIIILTARGQSQDLVRGLGMGADDYIAKPFETEELLARARARIRNNKASEAKYIVEDLLLNTQTLEVKRGLKNIVLSPQEFKILSYLMANKGRVLTRELILNRLWRNNLEVESRVVDVYIGYLRKKIDTGFEKKLIHSVRGFGYKIGDFAN